MTIEQPGPAAGIPACVEAVAAGRDIRLLWANAVDGLSFVVGSGQGSRFVKWVPAGSELDLSAEAVRLAWAGQFTPVATTVSGPGTWTSVRWGRRTNGPI